jgi:hypothetical protein
MKKLVTAFAACMIAGLVSASVESQNIVGYKTTTAPAGYSMFAPVFTTVGSATAVGSLSDIQGDFSEWDQIQFFDASGELAAVYNWVTAGTSGQERDGWCNDSFELVELTDLPQGASYLLSTAAEVQILNSGEVRAEELAVVVGAGYAGAGNGTATDRQLSEIVFAGDISEWDQIQFFDPSGEMAVVYNWVTAGTSGQASDGWCNDSFELVDFPVPAGQGFLLSTSAGCSMTIPSPFAAGL